MQSSLDYNFFNDKEEFIHYSEISIWNISEPLPRHVVFKILAWGGWCWLLTFSNVVQRISTHRMNRA
ncbi:hypothetical protein T01_3760 [Trichinella spiralis]|uniref:Uncharacterized protein n=1 Tax=Trichinella spiralis TaxID=6334 RepID=A0A0V1BX01_TRISP|nr:hypothetical protein T01_3760 [Trichinella spiralis]